MESTDKTTNDLLRYEYDKLTERLLHDSRTSYQLMATLIAISQAILGASILYPPVLKGIGGIGYASASLSALLLWYVAERRFVWAEEKRSVRLIQIERELKIYNERLFKKDEEINDIDLEEDINRVDKKNGIFSKIRIRHLYKLFIGAMILAWILILYHAN